MRPAWAREKDLDSENKTKGGKGRIKPQVECYKSVLIFQAFVLIIYVTIFLYYDKALENDMKDFFFFKLTFSEISVLAFGPVLGE